MGPLGWPEMVFIFVLALLLFGPKKLPELGRTLGKAITEFRRASDELKSTFEREMRNLEQETDSLKQVANNYYTDTFSSEHSAYNHEPDTQYSYGSPTDGASASLGAENTAAAALPAAAETVLEIQAPQGAIAQGSLENEVNHHETFGHDGYAAEVHANVASVPEAPQALNGQAFLDRASLDPKLNSNPVQSGAESALSTGADGAVSTSAESAVSKS